MTYDTWKTTNPADEFLGPKPDPGWKRSSRYDKRSTNGDDWNADAWKHLDTGEIRWTYAGTDINTTKAENIWVLDI